MSLQKRLTLFFVLIVIVPLLAAALIVQRVISSEISNRAVISLRPALDATVARYNEQSQALEGQVRGFFDDNPVLLRLLQRGSRTDLTEFLNDDVAASRDVDFVIVERAGEVIAHAMEPGEFVQGFDVPDTAAILSAEGGTGPGFVRSASIPLEVGGGVDAQVVGGFWLDAQLLSAASRSDVDLSMVIDGSVAATTAPIATPIDVEVGLDGPFETDLDEPSKAIATAVSNDVALVATTPSGPITRLSRDVLTSMLALLVLALLGTMGLGYLLARLITQPLDELAEGARAIASGRYGHQIAVRSGDEVGQLASSFNDMSQRLSATITELSSSRETMQRAIRRVGETLRSTHDMRQMLESILNTAADAVSADAAVYWGFTPTRSELSPRMMRGFDSEGGLRVALGQGVVGFVAERGSAIAVPGADGAPRPARGEPPFPVAMAVPVYSEDRMTGVITLYRDDAGSPFTKDDLETVSFLADQGGVAIENVRLHEEAQRLSLTDGLTGVWNRRFMKMQFRQVLATATRFERPFSIVMLDLDNFKGVNDSHGHQRGDAVLIEFTQRVTHTLREVDTFARYGGEEFICLLPETDVNGALTTADKIHEAIRTEPFGGPDEAPLNITVSIGVASYPEHGDSFESLVEAADQALYSAKQTGRDRVCMAQPQLKLA